MQIFSDKNEHLQLYFIGSDGKVALANQLEVRQGFALKSINIQSLPAGRYFLKIVASGKEQSPISFEKLR